jgi:hypothetical protein
MSLLHKIDAYQNQIRDADRKRPEYSVVLAVVCLALVLLLISARFMPEQGNWLVSEIPFVGP